MMLFIDGTHKGIPCENVNYWIQSYESGFELLTQLVADQWILTSAILVDDGDCISLPVDAFDGKPIQVYLDRLQQEWTQLLAAKPRLSSPVNTVNLKNWYTQLDGYYSKLLVHLEKMIFALEARKQKASIRRNQNIRHLLNRQYECRLELNRKLYQQTQRDRKKNQRRLLDLEK